MPFTPSVAYIFYIIKRASSLEALYNFCW